MVTIITCYMLLGMSYYHINIYLCKKLLLIYNNDAAKILNVEKYMNFTNIKADFSEFDIYVEQFLAIKIMVIIFILITMVFEIIKFYLIWWLHNILFVMVHLDYINNWGIFKQFKK